MKLIKQSIIGSVVLHIIYFVGMMIIGYFKTVNVQPNSESAIALENEVAFGATIAPSFYLVTFISAAVLCGVLLFSYQRFLKR
ncbi:hypothetical protein [Pseudalkalibacillus berkeleyi]|uniref:Menaquinol-cytochrome c reductase cytochrome b subunit n=1 Tax=Pseudalkalibacillus berkeleyi TaxID=1069813 RepID=A0ABS9GY49_9BACL|nr:hypothetical protein [Pseudalkalibacillus berkeleyi]MCF6136596.1 hypothetical protein [Pseudalkalibacillus berkeleyi]